MCEYCEEDKDGYVKFLPKCVKGFNAYIYKTRMNTSRSFLTIRGAYSKEGIFNINFCPMCGKKLVS